MASFSVPCPKTSASASTQALHPYPKQNQLHPHISISFQSDSKWNSVLLAGSSQIRGSQVSSKNQHDVFRVRSQLNDVAVGKLSNSKITEQNSEKSNERSGSKNTIPDVASFSALMNQVTDLVELVDSRDISELQLKQLDCELLIRKKEALPPPLASAHPPPQVMLSFQPPPVAVAAAAPDPSPLASAAAPPAPPKPSSNLPPLKSPLAGTFYRCPAPGAPPFVKIGDKVQKGQVFCIIEAMKLMNEIEADQSGTIIDILVDDAKPVSLDTPLFVIEP